MCTHTFDRLSLQTNVQALLFDIQSGEMAGNSKHALFSSDYFLTNRHFSYHFPIFDLKVTKKSIFWFFCLFLLQSKNVMCFNFEMYLKNDHQQALSKNNLFTFGKSPLFLALKIDFSQGLMTSSLVERRRELTRSHHHWQRSFWVFPSFAFLE